MQRQAVKNADIRSEAAKCGVYLWEVAAVVGMHDTNFSRKLRFELAGEEKAKIIKIIYQIQSSRG
jgi:hypothetical protein